MLMRDELKAALEAVLFMRSDYVNTDELVELLDVPLLDLKMILREMILEYNKEKRGIQIVEVDNAFAMCTNPLYSDIISRMEKPVRRRLTAAAMETLAIIAYQQPVTRLEIEKIRGVKSDKIINNLLEKGLIEEAGQKAVAGRPLLYVTTDEFLRLFGLSSIDELPDLEEENAGVGEISGRRNKD
jgi:segregation and condensation protein B